MKRAILLSFILLVALLAACGSGSSEQCKNYCRYSGSDTFNARKDCEKRGCKVSGTASCPTAVNYKVCMIPVEDSTKTVASLLQCSSPRS